MKSFNILDFGAVSGGKNVTREIQSTIDACFLAGGGEVVIPAGEFTVGCIRLRSNITLHLLENAALVGSRDPEDYFSYLDDKVEPISDEEREHTVPTVVEGAKVGRSAKPYSRWNNAIIRVLHAKNIAIIGEPGSRIDGRNCYDSIGEEGYRGPHPINMWYCENIDLRGYTIIDGGNWGHAIQNSQNITVHNVTVYGGHDGFDVRTCDNILIEDCTFESGDDCIAGFDNIGVTVRRCTLISACSLMRFGGTDVLVEDCTGHAATRYGFRKNLTDEKKIAGAPTDETCRHNCHTVFLYYCDNRAKIRKTPGNILIRNCKFDNVDAIFNLPFGHIWACNKSLDNIRFENSEFTRLHLPTNILSPDGEPLALTIRDCKLTFADDYGDAPLAVASGHKLLRLENLDIENADTRWIDAKTDGKIEIVNSGDIKICAS